MNQSEEKSGDYTPKTVKSSVKPKKVEAPLTQKERVMAEIEKWQE